MAYVSCRYAPPIPEGLMPDKEGVERIICTDENGIEWTLTTDSQVGDWLRYQEADGEVRAYEAPEAKEEVPSEQA